jgi:hypothetical protein
MSISIQLNVNWANWNEKNDTSKNKYSDNLWIKDIEEENMFSVKDILEGFTQKQWRNKMLSWAIGVTLSDCFSLCRNEFTRNLSI